MSNEVASKLEPWSKLKGKVVMVTGASSGLGREFCVDLAKAGCNIVAAARRVGLLKSLCDEINEVCPISDDDAMPNKARAMYIELYVNSNGATIKAAVHKAWDAFGSIDALVNNAGVRGSVHTPLDLTEEEWNNTIKTNITGAWLVSKCVCMLMCNAKQGGSVINISSMAGLDRTVPPGGLIYSTSKAALNTMTKVMAMELGMYNIRVNSISSRLFKSQITQKLM